jgi:hypothetical protein
MNELGDCNLSTRIGTSAVTMHAYVAVAAAAVLGALIGTLRG